MECLQHCGLKEQQGERGQHAGRVPPNVRQGSARTAGPETLPPGRGTGVAGEDVSSASSGFF